MVLVAVIPDNLLLLVLLVQLTAHIFWLERVAFAFVMEEDKL